MAKNAKTATKKIAKEGVKSVRLVAADALGAAAAAAAGVVLTRVAEGLGAGSKKLQKTTPEFNKQPIAPLSGGWPPRGSPGERSRGSPRSRGRPRTRRRLLRKRRPRRRQVVVRSVSNRGWVRFHFGVGRRKRGRGGYPVLRRRRLRPQAARALSFWLVQHWDAALPSTKLTLHLSVTLRATALQELRR